MIVKQAKCPEPKLSSSQNSKHLQMLCSVHEGMEGALVGDRELQATTVGHKSTRTTAMTSHVDLGR